MKIVAIKRFTDKMTKEVYAPGDVISHFSDERVNVAVEKGLALIVVDKDTSRVTKESVDTDIDKQYLQVKDGKIVAAQPEKSETSNQTVKDIVVQATEVEDAGQTVKAATPGQPEKRDVDATLTDIDMSLQWQKVIALIKVFGDVEKLKGYLEAENAADKPRVSVIAALEGRISELSNKGE
ncbi:hypothetical protein [Parabacteroides goldsteinii]|uniref:hypothetical protein n=1 Tax=Parabacteroides goldsteinii TaxID=328812 RepID=UPI0032B29F7C